MYNKNWDVEDAVPYNQTECILHPVGAALVCRLGQIAKRLPPAICDLDRPKKISQIMRIVFARISK